MEPPSPLSPTKPLSDEKRFSQARKPSQPLHATPSITLDPDAWVAYLVLSGISVTEDMNAICHNAVTAARKNFPGALPDQQVMNMVMRAMSAKVGLPHTHLNFPLSALTLPDSSPPPHPE